MIRQRWARIKMFLPPLRTICGVPSSASTVTTPCCEHSSLQRCLQSTPIVAMFELVVPMMKVSLRKSNVAVRRNVRWYWFDPNHFGHKRDHGLVRQAGTQKQVMKL